MRLFLLSVLLAGAACSEAVDPAPLPALPLGIAFPPVQDAEQRAFTVVQLDDLGIRDIRFAQPWSVREPERDRFAWGPLDARIADLTEAGVRVFLTLSAVDAPDWLDALPPDEQEAEFREYVRALLARLGADLASVQYGNEWNVYVETPDDADRFVRFANVLSDEVQRLPEADRPRVVLGSVSIGALSALAFLQGRIENVVFEGGPLYSEAEIADARAQGPAFLEILRSVVGGVRYDAVDLHLYDDVWNWPLYRAAFEQLLTEAGADPAVEVVVSEFGGPHPTLEPAGEAFQARRVEAYVRALSEMDVERAYFFKLVEERGAQIAHPNSFLIDADLRRTAAFDVLARVPRP